MAERIALRRYPEEGGKGLSVREYQRWEAGEAMPSFAWLEAIATELGVSVADVYGDNGDGPSGRSSTLGELSEQVEALAAELRELRHELGQPAREHSEPRRPLH